MEEALRALLIGHAPLTALVAQRIVWNHLPQKTTRPAVVLYRIAGSPGLTMQGSDGLTGATVQIDVQVSAAGDGDTPVRKMWAIRDVLVSLLHGYRGGDFQLIALVSEDHDSGELAGADSLVHRARLDFSVWVQTP